MSYSKTTWETGDTITAQLLNHAEDGIAANDAAIAAIPAGLQLYGPYLATGQVSSVAAGLYAAISCSEIVDAENNSVDYPDTFGAMLLAGFALMDDQNAPENLIVGSVYTPSKESDTVSPAQIGVTNNRSDAATIIGYVQFYSTVQFPAHTE